MGQITDNGIQIEVTIKKQSGEGGNNDEFITKDLYLKPSEDKIHAYLKGPFKWQGEVRGIKVEFEQKGKDNDPLPEDINIDERIIIDKRLLVRLIGEFIDRETR